MIELQPVLAWLTAIVDLSAGPAPEAPKLRLYADGLAHAFPAEAFTRESAYAVVQGSEFFPGYGALCERLAAWWKEHRPSAGPMLPGPQAPHLDHEAREWVASWQRRAARNWQPREAGDPGFMTALQFLALVRGVNQPAFRHLTDTDPDAAAIAVQHRWRTE